MPTVLPPAGASPGSQLWLGRALARSGALQALDRVMRAVTQAGCTPATSKFALMQVHPVISRWVLTGELPAIYL